MGPGAFYFFFFMDFMAFIADFFMADFFFIVDFIAFFCHDDSFVCNILFSL